MTHLSLAAREAVRGQCTSKIREVANAGMGRKDVPLWLGEPDEVTPAFIRQAGIDALNAGETFARTTAASPSFGTRLPPMSRD